MFESIEKQCSYILNKLSLKYSVIFSKDLECNDYYNINSVKYYYSKVPSSYKRVYCKEINGEFLTLTEEDEDILRKNNHKIIQGLY